MSRMALQPISETIEFAGRELSIETGILAPQASGAVTVRYGDSMVLVTAVATEEAREDIDFLPLVVDFEARMYAAGRIPGHRFYRREGPPSIASILAARLIDRSIRPLFPKGACNDVQVIVTALASDLENHLDIPGLIGASAALCISDIPFDGPIGAVRVGLIDGEFVINPTYQQMQVSELDLVVVGTREAVVMIEAGAKQIPEEKMLEAIKLAHDILQPIIEVQERLCRHVGKPKRELKLRLPNDELVRLIKDRYGERITEALCIREKLKRESALTKLLQEIQTALVAEFPEFSEQVKQSCNAAIKELVNERTVKLGVRADGRRLEEMRPVSCSVGISPRVHGSGLFIRGETQVLTIATLGATTDEMWVDSLMEEEVTKRFMHQYNFPPYSVGDAKPLRAPSRREIGHGALAEKALEAVIPPEEEFPYTIRLVTEVLSSNGSTSMASVCGGTLALMDAAVPILAPVAGISIGLMSYNGIDVLLTDIQGIEDAHGEMDFKIAGTRNGITAIQLDLKRKGLSHELIGRAFEMAKAARLEILEIMAQVIDKPRPEVSPYAPRIKVVHIPSDKIGDLIGPRGKHLKQIELETAAKIEIEPDGTVYITCPDSERAEKAEAMVRSFVQEPIVGETYKGRVTRLGPSYAFVEILPGKEGFIHVRDLTTQRVSSIADLLRIGDELEVCVENIDNEGRIKLRLKEPLQPQPIRWQSSTIQKPHTRFYRPTSQRRPTQKREEQPDR
ncbi:MAG: polyribonucleotide nucleotidyltransferase [Armatimonadota bacterium]|nr:polyribonucleotide nucleotidyltransferase [Armatimonadota bacterium]MCX7777779.1 polyribonucleotide nucleotidyltransferase [Armatimonadota bacterium]MDW8025334.1 polyribonucleotide nucleotidyltransferase [Armatimonadota bacterium]